MRLHRWIFIGIAALTLSLVVAAAAHAEPVVVADTAAVDTVAAADTTITTTTTAADDAASTTSTDSTDSSECTSSCECTESCECTDSCECTSNCSVCEQSPDLEECQPTTPDCEADCTPTTPDCVGATCVPTTPDAPGGGSEQSLPFTGPGDVLLAVLIALLAGTGGMLLMLGASSRETIDVLNRRTMASPSGFKVAWRELMRREMED